MPVAEASLKKKVLLHTKISIQRIYSEHLLKTFTSLNFIFFIFYIHLVVFILFFLFHFSSLIFFFFQAEDGIRDRTVTGVQTCALPIYRLAQDIRRGGVLVYECRHVD